MASIADDEAECNLLLTDSRRVTDVHDALFFAIPTKRNTGCRFVYELYQRGVRNFVVPADSSEDFHQEFSMCRGANFWFVKDVVRSLQHLAAHHRSLYHIPVVGITGSNGKTIVKDWIVQMLSGSRKVVASPRSYNSQIGVPLSVWNMTDGDELAVFEAGISEVGEMDHLRSIIDPTIGIFTNIGQAHDEHFVSRNQKLTEKLHLFTHCETLIYCSDHKDIQYAILEQEVFRDINRFTWGLEEGSDVRLLKTDVEAQQTHLVLEYKGGRHDMVIPFVDRASAENAMHCIMLLFFLGMKAEEIAQRCLHLTPVAMRLEMNEAINGCMLVNDSYSLDLNSLAIALDYLQHDSQHAKRTLIMSDILQSGLVEQDLYGHAAEMMRQHDISRFVGIGEALQRNADSFKGINASFFVDTATYMQMCNPDEYNDETILLKGARPFHFEDIAKMLQRRTHQTIMEVNLNNLVDNLNYFRSRIRPNTKLMAMVKAASYGAGKVEVANALQYNHVDYLTVAYTDEGVELRRNGITVPIMVMNPEEESFDDIIRYHLEPDIYGFRIFDAFSEAVRLMGAGKGKVPVHVELDTGMHRLGFCEDDLNELARRFGNADCVLQLRSIFSHLACSEDAEMDDFTHQQIDRFTRWSSGMKQALGDKDVLCHILNSSGIIRFPEAQMDMVRLGIGLYGIAPQSEVQKMLKPVSKLKTRISQVKSIPAGETVGYNRRWVAQRASRIAIISIGYADGLNRHLGYENGRVLVNGSLVPIIGSICMDMCFLDVTDVECQEGDEVIIFGDAALLQRISDAAGTIPYEILTSVSPRVKRVYYQE